MSNKFKWAPVAAALMVVLSPTSWAQSLEQAVASALDSHPDVRAAFSRFKARAAEVDVAKAGYLPSLNATAGYGYERTQGEDSSSRTELDRRELGVSLRQMLFDGFATSSEVNRTEAERDAEQLALLATAEDMALGVSDVYLKLLAAQQLEQLAKENLEAHLTIHSQIRQRTESGVGSASDLSQINSRLALARSNLVAAVNNRVDVEAQFMRQVNAAPEALVLPVPDADLLPKDLPSALEIARTSNPVLKSAARDIEAAQAQRERAKANNYPELALEVGSNWDNNVDGIEGANDNLQAMLRLRYNLFAGGADRARTEAAAWRVTEAQEINARAHRQLDEGTRLAWSAYELIGEQIAFLRDHVSSAVATRNAYQKQFDLGKRGLLDLLDAENELFEARRSYVSGERDLLLAQYRLLNATGQLLASLRVELPAEYKGQP